MSRTHPPGTSPGQPAPHLLVATPGGHVEELYELADRQLADRPRVWVTAATPQTRSLLAGQRVEWVDAVQSGQVARAARGLSTALRIVRRIGPASILSTGAALSAPYLLAGRLCGVPVHYVESATRTEGPSRVGQLAERLPGVRTSHQTFTRPRPGWQAEESVFANYHRVAGHHDVRSVFVCLGTEQFAFSRLVDAVLGWLPETADVSWQLGTTPAPAPLPGETTTWLSRADFVDRLAAADLVITHAGVGAVLGALRAGHVPVVMARRGDRGEHIDHHQTHLVDALARRELAIGIDDGGQLADAVAESARFRVVRRPPA